MAFLKTVLGSFYCPQTYRDAFAREGYGLGYSFLLVVLTTLLLTALTVPSLQRVHRELFVGDNGRPAVLDDVLAQVVQQMPVMTLQNHRLQTQDAKAHVIHVKAELMGEVAEGDIITIDTTGNSSSATMKTPVLITADEVIMEGRDDKRVRNIKDISREVGEEAIVITPEMARDAAFKLSQLVRENAAKFYAITGVVGLLCFVLVMYLLRVCLLAVLALGGLVIASMLKLPMEYRTAMRMAAVSFTPVALLAVVMPWLRGGGAPNALALLVCGWVMLAVVLRLLREPQEAA